MKSRIQKNIFLWRTVGVLAFLIFFFSVIPVDSSIPGDIDNIDKIFHFCAYAVFALVLAGTLKKQNNLRPAKVLLFTLISAGVYGILIELVQKALPYREAELADVYSNLSGAVMGIIISKVIKW